MSKIIIVDEKGTIRNLKNKNVITCSFLESKWDSILESKVGNKTKQFSFSESDWNRVKSELGIKGGSASVCLDFKRNVLAILKLEDVRS